MEVCNQKLFSPSTPHSILRNLLQFYRPSDRSAERPVPDLFRLIFLLGHSLGHAHFCSTVQRERAVFQSIRSLSSSFQLRWFCLWGLFSVNIMQGLIIGSMISCANVITLWTGGGYEPLLLRLVSRS
nr:unnamed protein product [Spirometra erinaceieuropaei]